MEYITQKGDTWDKIAYEQYGDETLIAPLLEANTDYIDVAVFDFGTKIIDNPENRMISSYKTAKEYADSHGIKIYNATRGGKLEVYERVNLDEVLKKS